MLQFLVIFIGKQWGNPDGKKVLCLHGWVSQILLRSQNYEKIFTRVQ